MIPKDPIIYRSDFATRLTKFNTPPSVAGVLARMPIGVKNIMPAVQREVGNAGFV